MIVENLVDFFFTLIEGLFRTFEIVSLPLDLVNVLTTITAYGVWIVGADLLAIFVLSVLAWWAFKFLVGVIIWLWELLPLT